MDSLRPITDKGLPDLLHWLGRKGGGLRLPSEAEWEHLCRAGTSSPWSFGDKPEQLLECAWFEANSAGRPRDVMILEPNGFGLYDVHGNVWEWCKSGASDKASSGNIDDAEWVIRGGSIYENSLGCRSAVRERALKDSAPGAIGFRIVASIPEH